MAGIRRNRHKAGRRQSRGKKCRDIPVTRIDILDRRGEAALGKPVGSYRTLDLSAFWQRSEGFFDRAVRAVGQQLRELIPDSAPYWWQGLETGP